MAARFPNPAWVEDEFGMQEMEPRPAERETDASAHRDERAPLGRGSGPEKWRANKADGV